MENLQSTTNCCLTQGRPMVHIHHKHRPGADVILFPRRRHIPGHLDVRPKFPQPQQQEQQNKVNTRGAIGGGILGAVVGNLLLPGIGGIVGGIFGAILGGKKNDDAVSNAQLDEEFGYALMQQQQQQADMMNNQMFMC